MKKLLVVLGLGLTMMSCSKEEIPVVEIEEEVVVVPLTCEGGFEVMGFGYRIGEDGMPIYSVSIIRKPEDGGQEWIKVFKGEYDALVLEYSLNGIACWGMPIPIEDDLTAPRIRLIGEELIILELNAVYIDEGATAIDNRDGDITLSIVTTSDVDTSVLGTYRVVYTAEDEAGNVGERSRMIIVR